MHCYWVTLTIHVIRIGTQCRSASREERTVDGFEGALRNSKSKRRNERERWPRLNVAAAEKGFSRFSVSREGREEVGREGMGGSRIEGTKKFLLE